VGWERAPRMERRRKRGEEGAGEKAKDEEEGWRDGNGEWVSPGNLARRPSMQG